MFKGLVAALVVTSVAADSCTSLASISHSTTGCPAGEGTPDCTYIQNNDAAICAAILPSWEIVNAPACQLKGTAYGCVFIAGTYTTTDTFCCPLVPSGGGGGVAPASASASGSASASPVASGSPTGSGSPSVTGSGSVTWTPSASASTYPTRSMSPSPSASASASPSGYPSYTSSYSANPTLTSTASINASKIPSITAEGLSQGEKMGIGFGVGIGAFVLLGCGACLGFYCRRARPASNTPPVPVVLLAERRGSAVAERRPSTAERRSSAVAAVAERRSSVAALQLRAPTSSV